MRQGLADRLAESIHYMAEEGHAIIGTNKFYTAMHQVLDKERPFWGVQNHDISILVLMEPPYHTVNSPIEPFLAPN
jgi:phage gpG-like protein